MGSCRSGGGARALMMFPPSAMERFWEEIHAAAQAGTLDRAKLETLRRTYHMQSIGPFPHSWSEIASLC